MKQIAKIYLGIYPFYLFVCVCENPADVDGLLRQHGYMFSEKEFAEWNDPKVADYRAMADKLEWRPYDTAIGEDAPTAFIIWVRRLPTNNYHVAELVHELSHISAHILMYINDPPNFADDEPHAYLMEYITEQVLNVLQPESKRSERSV